MRRLFLAAEHILDDHLQDLGRTFSNGLLAAARRSIIHPFTTGRTESDGSSFSFCPYGILFLFTAAVTFHSAVLFEPGLVLLPESPPFATVLFPGSLPLIRALPQFLHLLLCLPLSKCVPMLLPVVRVIPDPFFMAFTFPFLFKLPGRFALKLSVTGTSFTSSPFCCGESRKKQECGTKENEE